MLPVEGRDDEGRSTSLSLSRENIHRHNMSVASKFGVAETTARRDSRRKEYLTTACETRKFKILSQRLLVNLEP